VVYLAAELPILLEDLASNHCDIAHL
jgi:hypothetical protein